MLCGLLAYTWNLRLLKQALGGYKPNIWDGFLIGVLSGLATASHILYGMVTVLNGAIFLGVSLAGPKSPRRWQAPLVGILGLLVGFSLVMGPVSYYFAFHQTAFNEQFLSLISAHRNTYTSILHTVQLEAAKYADYYWGDKIGLVPFALGVELVSIASLGAGIWKNRNIRDYFWAERLVLCVYCIGLPLQLVVASDHKYWHHMIAIPYWGLAVGYFAHSLLPATRYKIGPRWIKQVAWFFISLAILNGLIFSLGAKTAVVAITAPERDVYAAEEQLAQVIPDGSKVFGDYSLYFIGRRHQWDFVTTGFLTPNWSVLQSEDFDYVVVLEGDNFPAGLLPEYYSLFLTVGPEPTGWWKQLNPSYQSFRYNVFYRVRH